MVEAVRVQRFFNARKAPYYCRNCNAEITTLPLVARRTTHGRTVYYCISCGVKLGFVKPLQVVG